MLSERIYEVMNLRGINQKELARRSGLSPQIINLIVSGKTVDPGVSKVIKICEALDVSFALIVLDDVPIDELAEYIGDEDED